MEEAITLSSDDEMANAKPAVEQSLKPEATPSQSHKEKRSKNK
ncbi:hypothetical protein A2U01_0095303, partial [Trifolium medium]|nr:hypothetical protein [Trifolium medium]